VAATLMAIAVDLMLAEPTVRRALWSIGDVSASLPVGLELWRLPMSVFLPTPYLPEWGAVLQLVVVLGLGELVLGGTVTLLTAGVGQLAATFGARLLIESPVGHLVGLPHALVYALDTGPSAVTVAVGAAVLVASKCDCLAAVLAVSLVGVAFVGPGLDGPEHLIGLVCGVAIGACCRQGRRARTPGVPYPGAT